MFVPDVAHQLLHDVLQGGNALRAPVLIHHHGHVGLVPLEDAHQLGDLGVAGGVEHRGLQGGDHGLPPVAGGVEVLLMDHAHDIVDAVLIDGQAGVTALRKEGAHLLHGAVLLRRHDIHPGSEDLGHLQVVELDGVADQLALVLVQAALVLRLVHHSDQLLLGDAVLLPLVDDQGEQALPLGEQEIGRGQHGYKGPQQGGREHGPGLRALLGQALGRDLAKDQDHHSEHDGGHRGPPHVIQQPDEQHRADGGGHVVDDVVSDEDGGQQLVIVLRQSQGPGSPLVPVVRPALQADPVQGGKGGLCGGEVSGHGHEDDKSNGHSNTGTVHGGQINSAFCHKFPVFRVLSTGVYHRY